jgi:hypothetical protein
VRENGIRRRYFEEELLKEHRVAIDQPHVAAAEITCGERSELIDDPR